VNAETAHSLRTRLEADAHADISSLRTDTDKTLSIGQDVWRLRWNGQVTTAVPADAGLYATCGALLDALAVLEAALEKAHATSESLDLDPSTINVLVDRAWPGEEASETDQALRSMRDAVQGVTARIWYQKATDGWMEDRVTAPTWRESEPRVVDWVNNLLMPRLVAQPGPLALALVADVDDPSLGLYPSEVSARSTDVWALRLDGLEIGTISTSGATLTIGKPGTYEDSSRRKVFTEVFGQPSITASNNSGRPSGQISIPEAALGIRALLRRFRLADVRGAPITHRLQSGLPAVDEHGLEARLLKGIVPLGSEEAGLVLDDDVVARGSQFPTLWGHGGEARYLDALVRKGTTPLAVELKVATGGQGRYYRRALVQAVLYRHFLVNAPGLEPWFTKAGLVRKATECAIGFPTPRRWTPTFVRQLEFHRQVAARVGADVYVLDDRSTPEWVAIEGLDAPELDQYELLGWRMAAALSSRWPRSLGRIVERHDAGGSYHQIELQGFSDRALNLPSPGPRVSLNRPGSLCVFSPLGSPRWVWREIWNYLAHDGDAAAAAVTVGAIAGLGAQEADEQPTFAQMALALLEATPGTGWSWRCASPAGGEVAGWVERFRVPLRRYGRTSPTTGTLPAVARIWGVVREGDANVIVDQDNSRIWVWDGASVRNLDDVHPTKRMEAAITFLFT
jgi:hypothetical protein